MRLCLTNFSFIYDTGVQKVAQGGGMVVQIKLYFQEFSSEHPKDYLLSQNFCLSFHEDFYYLKDYKSRKRCKWGPKNALTKGGGGLNLKESLTRVATIILGKK